MMKSVLISIKPKWCEKIASGEKTVEVRKTRPKIETPFRVPIYCTNTKPYLVWGDVFRGNWETEFTHLSGYNRKDAEKIWDVFNGKVIGEFVCDKIYDCRDVDIKDTCLTVDEWLKYTEGHKGVVYGWHISDLVIYDKPKELTEFKKAGFMTEEQWLSYLYPNTHCHYDAWAKRFDIQRPPQSWCYVEEVNGNG